MLFSSREDERPYIALNIFKYCGSFHERDKHTEQSVCENSQVMRTCFDWW